MESELPEKIRTFIGIFPPLPVAEKLKELERDCQKPVSTGAINWTKEEQIHLTLNFLGNIHSARVAEFEAALTEVSAAASSFLLRCQGLGCFPNPRKPAVLWAGLAGDLEPVRQLKSQLDEALAKMGIVPEERPFHPHLTLGRVKHLHFRERQSIQTAITESADWVFGEWRVQQIDFMRNSLSSSEGSQYSVLKSFPLR